MDVGIIQDGGIRIEKEGFSCNKLFSTTGKVSKRMRKVSNKGVEDSATSNH